MPEPAELRQAYDDAIAELKTLRKQVEALTPRAQREDFRAAGLDPDSEQAKAAIRLLGDKPPTADNIAEIRQEFPSLFATHSDNGDGDEGGESQPVVERDPASQARSDAIARTSELRGLAEPVGVQKVAYEQYQQIKATDPAQAAELMRSRRVELPPHLNAALTHNQLERANQLVVTGGDV